MANRSGTEQARWLRSFHSSAPGAPRLLCLPHAGGAANFYFSMSAALSPEVEVLAVQYPGRQDRRSELCTTSVEALADELFRVLPCGDDTPSALFGHSMGSFVGFELARRLHSAGRPPAVFFASGSRGPSAPRSATTHSRDDAGLIAEIEKLNGTDLTLLRDEEMLRMILPALRADIRAAETYRRGPGPQLSCPIVAMTGDTDPSVAVGDARCWTEETTGPFELLVHQGGHFYLSSRQHAVIAQVSAYLRRFCLPTSAVR